MRCWTLRKGVRWSVVNKYGEDYRRTVTMLVEGKIVLGSCRGLGKERVGFFCTLWLCTTGATLICVYASLVSDLFGFVAPDTRSVTAWFYIIIFASNFIWLKNETWTVGSASCSSFCFLIILPYSSLSSLLAILLCVFMKLVAISPSLLSSLTTVSFLS